MVKDSLIFSSNLSGYDFDDLAKNDLRWCSTKLNEVLEKSLRLEASFFTEGKYARKVISNCKWPKVTLCGANGLAKAYHRPRFKRIWVSKSEYPIFQPSQVLEVFPKPSGFISKLTKTDINLLRVKKGQILLTCSGTIGNCTVVGKTLDNQIFSHDLIRINCNTETDAGFLYAFLKTKIGNTLLTTNEYGSVVSHIEPEHLDSIKIPKPSLSLRNRVHELIMRSFELRDESNILLDKANQLLIKTLSLPPFDDLKPKYFDNSFNVKNFNINLSNLENRLDGSFHVPLVKLILSKFKNGVEEITTIDDPKASSRVFLPGRFSRVYVEEGRGAKFFGGKQLFELDPLTNKYLSLSLHEERIKNQLVLKENMIVISRSGTIGKVALVPKHWEGYCASEDQIRIVSKKNIAGFICVFLNSTYGQALLKKFIFGSVQDHIDDIQVSKTPLPLLKDKSIQKKINQLALDANQKRTEAYQLEQKAIQITNEKITFAP